MEFAVAVNSGTDALRFALIAAGVKRGDVVITVPHTFIATTEAISQAGAQPEFVDIDEHTYNIDPAKLHVYLETQCTQKDGQLISKRSGRPVTAIVPVHLYGQMADMDAILELAERYQLIVWKTPVRPTVPNIFRVSKIAGSKQVRWATPPL